ncbi:MAG: hypothetical protein ACOYXB_15665 [Bacteroidota bacterium]
MSIFNIIQFFPAFLIFFAIPRLFTAEDLVKFNGILFAFSIIHFLGSVVEIISPGSFMNLIYFGKPSTGVAYGKELIRFVGGITIHLYVMFAGLYYLSRSNRIYKSWYLWLVVLLSWLFILNSATRGWMIASSFFVLSYFIFNTATGKISIRTALSLILIATAVLVFIPDSFKKNIGAAFDRLETVEALTEGDDTAEGTLSRLTERGPRVLTRFSESPVVGYGFSRVTADYYDEHVGNHDLLLMGGVVGLAILWITFLSLIFFLFRKEFRNPGNGFYVIGLFMAVILIIHSTSRSMVSYYMSADAAFLISLAFNHFNTTFPGYLRFRTGPVKTPDYKNIRSETTVPE